jgi:hypothetical protein
MSREAMKIALEALTGPHPLSVGKDVAITALRAALEAETQFVSEETQLFALKIEKRLCELLGRKWSTSGMSIDTLIADIREKLEAEPKQYTCPAHADKVKEGGKCVWCQLEDAMEAEPKQEPVAWKWSSEIGGGVHYHKNSMYPTLCTPLYTAPQADRDALRLEHSPPSNNGGTGNDER